MMALVLAFALLIPACGGETLVWQTPDWLPPVEVEDFECRRPLDKPLVDWSEMRSQFRALAEDLLDPATLLPVKDDAVDGQPSRREVRQARQVELLVNAGRALLHFEEGISQCPLGTVTASLFIACLAHVPRKEVIDRDLPEPFERLLADIAQRPFAELVARDLRLLGDIAQLHVIAATEWRMYWLLNYYIDLLRPAARPGGPAVVCPGMQVVGYSSGQIRYLIRTYLPYASGKDMQGIKYLRGLDPLVSKLMKDPTEFSTQFMPGCPAGAAAFGAAAAMLALMSNPSLFERFAGLTHYVLKQHTDAVLAGASSWGFFHAVAKMAVFATRAFDLVWSLQELLPLPNDGQAFDRLRADRSARHARLAKAATSHQHPTTRDLASFLSRLPPSGDEDLEDIVYLTAVGGEPFSNYIAGFVQRAIAVGLPALIIACMDQGAQRRCEDSASGKASSIVHCVPAFEGHVVLIKHAFIPALLSAAVDVVWIDFDTFVLRDPTPAIREARDSPSRILPKHERVRFGSFLFESASDMCNLTKVCDARMQWPYSLTDSMEDGHDGKVEALVTEHWDARCLNNGLFYVRATHRPLIFFVLFLGQLHANPYTDNQNLFDAFLTHSSVDTAAPESRPLLRYSPLDIEHRFACAEGHLAESAENLVTFHFWSSDFHTREVAPGTEASSLSNETSTSLGETAADGPRDRIRTREGVERVSKVRATKSELFEMFFGGGGDVDQNGIPVEGLRFMQRVQVPKPLWKGMCAVTAVGIEELVDERMLQGDQAPIEWNAALGSSSGFDADLAAVAGHAPTQGAVAATAGAAADAVTTEATGASVTSGAQCSGIPWRDWVEGLRAVAELEDGGFLERSEAAVLKERLRRLDAACLLAIQAYRDRGLARLAFELRDLLSGSLGTAT